MRLVADALRSISIYPFFRSLYTFGRYSNVFGVFSKLSIVKNNRTIQLKLSDKKGYACDAI